jgi:carbamoyltransferase
LIILGLHGGHDGSASIVKNGKLIAHLASERLSRSKRSGGASDLAVDAVLKTAGITLDDVDYCGLTDWYTPWAHDVYKVECRDTRMTCVEGRPLKLGDFAHDTWDRIWDDEVYEVVIHIRGRQIPSFNIGHQKAHCAAAFYTSPYEDAWCMSMDSSGAKAKNNFMIARGSGKKIDYYETPVCVAGYLYGEVCDRLGIGSHMYKAGAMMALAAYGEVSAEARDRQDWCRNSGWVEGNGEYQSWVNGANDWMFQGQTFTGETSSSKPAADIAATTQYVFEQSIMRGLDYIPSDGVSNLCLSGGSFLNCNLNTAIARNGRFGIPHHFPACTDDGLSAGSALYVAHHIHGEKRATYTPKEIAYLGPKYPDRTPNLDRVAEAIAAGKVVGWFQGRSECGPRALGHRSILADPRSPTMKDHINATVKRREWYRPLSPSVLAEKSHEWFDFPADSPFMLFTAHCSRAADIPAVCHVDSSARMQTVRRSDNPAYYDLISRFEALTGVPMVLNTSLNVDGQPILETEEDARQMWETGRLDMMVCGGKVWER